MKEGPKWEWEIYAKHPNLWKGWKCLAYCGGMSEKKAKKQAEAAKYYYEGITDVKVVPYRKRPAKNPVFKLKWSYNKRTKEWSTTHNDIYWEIWKQGPWYSLCRGYSMDQYPIGDFKKLSNAKLVAHMIMEE